MVVVYANSLIFAVDYKLELGNGCIGCLLYTSFATIGCSLLMLNGMKKWRSVRKYQSYLVIVIDEELKKFD